MLAAVVGLLLKKSRQNPFFAGSLILLIAYVWAVYAWYLPNYPNGLGSRPMVDIYVVMALPLAAVVDRIASAVGRLKWPAIAFIIACVFINIQYCVKAATSSILTADSRLSFNLHTFFRYKLRYNDLVLWDLGVPQPDAAKQSGKSYVLQFGDSVLSQHIGRDSAGATKYYCMAAGEEFGSAALIASYSALAAGHKPLWLRCSGRFFIPKPVFDIYKNQLLVVELHRGDSLLAWYGLRINNKVGILEAKHSGEVAQLFGFRDHQWGNVSCLVPLPDGMQPADYVKLFVWNIGKTPVCVSKLSVSAAIVR